MSNRIKRLGKNTLLVFVGNLGAKLISVLMLPLYTRWLSVEEYGISDMIMVYSTLLLGMVTCCIESSLFIFPKDRPKEIQTQYFTTGIIFLIGMYFVTATIFGCIDFIIKGQNYHNTFIDHIWLIYFLLLSQSIQNVFQQFVRSIDKMVIYSLTGIVTTGSIAFFSFLLIPRLGIIGYVYSFILSYLFAAIFTFVSSKSYGYIKIKSVSITLAKEMLKFSVPLIPNGIMWWLVGALNRPLMEKYLGYYDIGIFSVANRFPSILTLFFSVFVTSWTISVIEEFKKDDFKVFYNKVFGFVFILSISVLIGLTVFSKLLISLFANPSYYDAWRFIPILSVSALFANLSSFVGTVFSATKQSKYYFYSSIAGASAAILFNILLIPRIGLWGASLSLVLSYFIMMISRIVFSWRCAPINKVGKYMVYSVFSFLIIAFYTAECHFLYLLLLILLFLILISLLEYNNIYYLLKYKNNKDNTE